MSEREAFALASEQTSSANRTLLKRVNELDLSMRIINYLENDDIVYIGDLVQKTDGEILRIPNFGRKALREIKELLAQMGLRLGTEVLGWPPANIEQPFRIHGAAMSSSGPDGSV
jgi:DNA-directed RNA polymerase subunit alpha